MRFLTLVYFCFIMLVPFARLRGAEAFALSSQAQVEPSTTVPVMEPAKLVLQWTANQKITLSSFTVPVTNELQFTERKFLPVAQNQDGTYSQEIELTFLPMALGDLEGPSLELPYQTESGKSGTFRTPPVKITVTGALQGMVSLDMLRDIKGPFAVGFLSWAWFALAAGLALTAAGIYLFRSKKKKQASDLDAALSRRPAGEVALEKLMELLKQYGQEGNLKYFYIALSVIVREYLEQRFQIDAPDCWRGFARSPQQRCEPGGG